jgi:hypothetical protein
MQAFMAMPVPYAEIKGIEDLGLSPECFRSFSSVLLVLGIDMTVDTPDVRALRATAGRLLQDPEFRRIVGIYRTIDDCAPMANKLLGYEVVEKNLW